MSYHECNPCNQPEPCDPCNQYDNCGCLNPTTFDCVTTSKVRSGIPTTMGENGEDILDKINSYISNIGKIKIDNNDNCPEFLIDKLAEGSNIYFEITGTGCDRQITIHATEGGVPVDVNAKVSSNDTTSGYLSQKIETGTYLTSTVLNPNGNEQLEIDVVPSTLLSADSGNQLTIGSDGKLKTAYSAPDGGETKLIQGVGTVVTGTGTLSDPYIISTNPSIQIARPCFDGVWRNINLVATGNPNVVYSSGQPQYRYRFDGTIEFRGQVTYNVSFGAYSTANRKFTITAGSFPITCLNSGELAGTVDMKGITYIDSPQASPDQIVQQYGYVIRRSINNIIIELQSSFTGSTSKSIVINFEGCVVHPFI